MANDSGALSGAGEFLKKTAAGIFKMSPFGRIQRGAKVLGKEIEKQDDAISDLYLKYYSTGELPSVGVFDKRRKHIDILKAGAGTNEGSRALIERIKTGDESAAKELAQKHELMLGFFNPSNFATTAPTKGAPVLANVTKAEKIVEDLIPYESSWKDIAGRFISSSKEHLRKESQFGKWGKVIADKFDLVKQESNLAKARDVVRLDEALGKLTKNEIAEFSDVAEGVKQAETDNMKDAIRVWDEIRTGIAKASEELGVLIKNSKGEAVPFKARSNYFPHVIPDGVLEDILKSSKKRGAFFQQMVDSGSAQNIAEAENIFNKYIRARSATKYGHLEKAREFDFPIWEKDPRKVLFEYVSGSHDRLAQARHFGIDDEIAKDLIEKIRVDGRDYQFAQKLFDRMAGREVFDPLVHKVSGGIRAFETVTKLGFGAITNLGQFVNTATRTGILPAVKGQFQALLKENRRFAREAGAFEKIIDDQIRAAGGEASIASKFLGMVGFKKVEANNRTVAALAGRNYASVLFDRLKGVKEGSRSFKFLTRRLEGLGVNVDRALKNGKLEKEDLVHAAYSTIKDTQFLVDNTELPYYWGSPSGKAITQFKSFAFQQARFVKKQVLDELKAGNVRPLLIYLAVGEAVGEAVGDMKASVRGRERPEGAARIVDNLMTIGGIGLVTDFATSIGRSSFEGGGLLKFIAGPGINDLADLLEGAGKLARGDAKPLLKELTSYIPVVGQRVRQALFPSKSQYRARMPDTPDELLELMNQVEEQKGSVSPLPGISGKDKSALPALPGL